MNHYPIQTQFNFMKTFISAIFILLLSAPIFSQTVGIEKATILSDNWALTHGINSEVENIIYKTVDKDTLLYIVNYKNAWVMISADKALKPILGFSLESVYDETNEADALKSLFDFYAYVKKENRANGVEYSAEWEEAASGNLKSEYSSGTVEPLLPVTWNQDWPYNAYCPENAEMSANFNGHHNTSCGPTAFAQILRYWKYPERGTGSHSYYYDRFSSSVSANFGSTEYNWDNMPAVLDFSDPESVYTDVAKLMLHVGVSVDNSYSSGGSLYQYTSAAVKYFGYAPTCRVLYREDFSNSGWHSIFRDDLNNGRPILIMANSAGSAEPWENGNVNGHYFVCDGYYGSDSYHINWGWEGSGNGYFPLFSLGSFVYHNHALIGLEPNYDKKELVLTDPYTTDNNTVVLMHFDGDLNNESSLSENPSQNGSISFEDNSSLGLGQSLYLDNSSQDNQSHLIIPDNDNLDLSGDWTIEMWFKPISLGNSYGQYYTMISKPGSSGNNNANYSASISPTNDYVDRALYCSFYPSPDIERNTGIIRTDKGFIETGKWYHFSFIRNTADKTMSLIIHDSNKKLIHYASDPYHEEKAANPRLNSNPLYIGFGYYTNTFFNGYIDELRVSNIVREPRIATTSVRITEPNGGEKWVPGNYKNIKWVSENVQEIKIEYSTDNGASWHTVVNNCSATRTGWSWEVPEVQSNECLIKITDTSDNSVVDISDGVFTIGEDEIEITEVSSSDLLCFGNANGSITITSTGGYPPHQYSIDNGSSWHSSNTFSSLNAGDYNIKVKDNTDNIASWASNPVQLSQPSEIVISSIGKENISSDGANDGSIIIYAAGGTGSREYSIDNGTTWQNSNSFSNLSSGSYYIKVKDENDCEKEYQYNPVIISGGNNLTIDSVEKTDVSLCHGNLNGIIIITASGGKAPYEYSIDNGDTWFSSNTFSGRGQDSYYIKVKDDENNIVEWGFNPLILFQPPEIIFTGVEKQNTSSVGTEDGAITIIASGGTGILEYSIDHGTTYQYTNSFTNLSQGDYYLKVKDANGCSKEYAYNPVIIGESSNLSIYDIQYTNIPGPGGTYPSLMADETVVIQGVVTATSYSGDGHNFFISSPNGGEWQAIYIYASDIEASIGDMVEVSGLVKEYYGVTEIYEPAVVVLSSGNQLPDPCAVITGDLVVPANAEAYEGCLVEVENITISREADNLGQWYIDDGSGECQVDDQIFKWTNISIGLKFDKITGVIDYDWSEYGIIPRYENDFSLSTGIKKFYSDGHQYLIYPNPSNSIIYIDIPQKTDMAIYSITGQKILEKKNFSSGTLDVTGFKKGIYYVLFNSDQETVSRKLVIN